MAALVSLTQILQYVGIGVRPITEGEQVLKAGLIILCGTISTNTIVGLCLQTSNLSGKPHKIDIILSEDYQNWKCVCTCKAGASAKCKHVVAILLHLNRTEELPEVSCTDLEQAWGKRKDAHKIVEVIPLEKFCHVGLYSNAEIAVTNNFLKDFFQNCIDAVPNSETARHIKRRNNVLEENLDVGINDTTLHRALTEHLCMKWDITFPPLNLTPIELDFYKQKIILSFNDAVNLAMNTLDQSTNNLWHSQRKLRITSSRCYEFFTYCENGNPNWEKKINSVMNSSFAGNLATRHGLKHENNAITTYQDKEGCTIWKCGLLVNPVVPWVGCSPDGLLLQDNLIIKLIEIKCPFKGSAHSIHELLLNKELNFINYDGIIKLKKNHKYYGQVQLYMGLLNFQKCDFVMYSSLDKNIVIIQVPFDSNFFVRLISKLHFVYFKHYLPQLCTRF